MADASAKPKRTRTNVKQSKFGCFTCKSRRVKCDEGKPACQRCLISKRECLGYPRGAYPDSDSAESTTLSIVSASSSPSDSSSPSPTAVISTLRSLAFNPYTLSSPFVDLGCTVLAQSPRRARNNVEQTFWSRTVPQLAQSIPSVRAAIEAFGTSYSEYVLRGTSPRPGFETTKRYSQALRMVQQDLITLPHGPIPCVVACLFLGFVEALQQRLNKALLHLHGTFSLMMSLTDKQLQDVIDTDSLVLLLKKLDLHVATYAVSHPPNLPLKPFVMGEILQSYPPDGSLFEILHSSYHFTAKAFRYKYTSRRTIPPELLMEQGRQLANLKQWLSLNEIPPTSNTESHESLIVLRSQCLAALVNTATIMEPRETAYDCYGPEFEEIITSIGALLLSKSLQEHKPRSFKKNRSASGQNVHSNGSRTTSKYFSYSGSSSRKTAAVTSLTAVSLVEKKSASALTALDGCGGFFAGLLQGGFVGGVLALGGEGASPGGGAEEGG
nr:hypothetical protein FVER53263_20796 [Fusarium verticillioides]